MQERKIISIEKSEGIADIELLLRELNADGPCDVLVPRRLHERLIGGVCTLIQFLVTWSKKRPAGSLLTHVKREEPPEVQLTNLILQDHGLVGVLAAQDIRTRKGEVSVKGIADALAYQRLKSMADEQLKSVDELQLEVSARGGAIFPSQQQSESRLPMVQRAVRGEKVFLVCADDTSYAHLPLLYHQTVGVPKSVKGEADFKALAGRLLRRTAEARRGGKIPKPCLDSLGAILYELFSNSDEWAKTEYDGRPVDRSLRGIRVEQYADSHDVLLKHVRGSPPLNRYLSHANLARSDPRRRFVEIAVFDSGPGLAQRWLEKAISEDEPVEPEYNAVLDCLKKRGTTSPRSHRGLGLDRVMKTLTQLQGFLRIRTGRLALYRDFLVHPYDPEKLGSSQEPFMLDWESDKREPSRRERVEGVLFTMLIPIRFT